MGWYLQIALVYIQDIFKFVLSKNFVMFITQMMLYHMSN